jgi:hypothetical protein
MAVLTRRDTVGDELPLSLHSRSIFGAFQTRGIKSFFGFDPMAFQVAQIRFSEASHPQ